MRNDFAIFILSHGSPNECLTEQVLNNLGNTNKYYLIVDNEDSKLDEYKFKYLTNLLIFDKQYYVSKADTMYCSNNIPKNTPLYARMASEDFAKKLNLSYFCLMDDDVQSLKIRYPNEHLKNLPTYKISDFDKLVDISIDYLYNTNSYSVSFSSQNLFIGGYSAFNNISERRLCFNIFIRNTSKPFEWRTVWYDDFNTCMLLNKVGKLTLNIPFIQSNCKPQGSSKQLNSTLKGNSGMVLQYKQSTAFNRALYCVIVSPSCVKVKDTTNNGNYWPSVSKNNAFPKIISSRYKK